MVFPAVNDTTLSLGVFVGIAVGMFWYERELLSPGGVVVPGYTALFLLTNQFLIVGYSVGIALLTAVIVKYASRMTILFGRRRFAVTMLTALTLTFMIRPLFSLLSGPLPFLFTGPTQYQGFQVIGIIIPGLIANEVHRQGVVPTFSTLAIVSVITALIVYALATLL